MDEHARESEDERGDERGGVVRSSTENDKDDESEREDDRDEKTPVLAPYGVPPRVVSFRTETTLGYVAPVATVKQARDGNVIEGIRASPVAVPGVHPGFRTLQYVVQLGEVFVVV